MDEQRHYIESLPNKVYELMADVEAQRGWYELLEGMRYLLPEEDLKEKFAGESWGMRLTRQAEKQLEVLAGDEARFKGEMITEQDMFRDTIGDLQVVSSYRTQSGGEGLCEQATACLVCVFSCALLRASGTACRLLLALCLRSNGAAILPDLLLGT